MSTVNVGFICLVAVIVWFVLGSLMVRKLDDPKTNKQSLMILILLGPAGFIIAFIILVKYWLKIIYKKLGE